MSRFLGFGLIGAGILGMWVHPLFGLVIATGVGVLRFAIPPEVRGN